MPSPGRAGADFSNAATALPIQVPATPRTFRNTL
jgi:hypothetical protein